MINLPLAAIVFVAAHIVFSGTPLRGKLAGAIGEGPFRGLFSLIALAAMVWLVWAYGNAPLNELWDVEVLAWVPLVLMPFALILLVAGITAPNPSAAGQEGRFRGEIQARGILRITRHPLQMAIALWALGHLLVRGDTASLWFFGALLVLSVTGSISLDRKKAGQLGDRWRAFMVQTSLVPFAAIAAGRNRLSLQEIGWWRIVLGLAAYGLLLVGHEDLFGVGAY